MIRLGKDDLIGKGRSRECYRHPECDHLCLKVDGPGADQNGTADEVAYLAKLGRMRPEYDGSAHSRFRGWQMTNLGAAAAFELVRNDDGTIAPSLFRLLWSEEPRNPDRNTQPNTDWEKVFDAIADFRQTLLRHAIPVRDLNPNNVCVRRAGDGYQIIAVDCIGHREFIPAIDVVPWLARKQIQRRFEKFSKHRLWLHRREQYREYVTSDAA